MREEFGWSFSKVVDIDKMQYGFSQGEGLLMLCLF